MPDGDDNFFFIIEGSRRVPHPRPRADGPARAVRSRRARSRRSPDPHDEAGEFEVRVKRDGEFTSLWFAWHPLDVVGWQGDLCPVKLNILDHRPVYSPSYHMPPSAHCTFENQGFVICSFVPRPLEEDPAVLKVPFYHANIDADEVLFYHSGDYFSRAGIDVGYMTLHPQGVHHGPQPAAIEASKTNDAHGRDRGDGRDREAARPVARGRRRRHHRVRDLVGPRHGSARRVSARSRCGSTGTSPARGLPAAPRGRGRRRRQPVDIARCMGRGHRARASRCEAGHFLVSTLRLIEQGPEVWAEVSDVAAAASDLDELLGRSRRLPASVCCVPSTASRRCGTSSRSRIT